MDISVRAVQLGPVWHVPHTVWALLDGDLIRARQDLIRAEGAAVWQVDLAGRRNDHPVGQVRCPIGCHFRQDRQRLPKHLLALWGTVGDFVGAQLRSRLQNFATCRDGAAVRLDNGAVWQDDVPVGEHHAPIRHNEGPVVHVVLPSRAQLGLRAIWPDVRAILKLDGTVWKLEGVVWQHHKPVGQDRGPIIPLGGPGYFSDPARQVPSRNARRHTLTPRGVLPCRGGERHVLRRHGFRLGPHGGPQAGEDALATAGTHR
mmetsp:Transcript_147501/g.257883  ORF Transcript_147501/g.257883 Transcript_147501/m.257883 type:complete len:259 (+) Transcript_147501:5814-6590(+)